MQGKQGEMQGLRPRHTVFAANYFARGLASHRGFAIASVGAYQHKFGASAIPAKNAG